MPRRTQEHNDRISAAITHRYQDDPDYAVLLSKKARDRWNAQFYAEVTTQLEEFEEGTARRRILVGMRYLERLLAEGRQLDPDEAKFKNALREVLSGDFITRIEEEQ
jgi:hypothetical protein